MSEDEGPDSDSSGREFCRRIMRPRSRRSKEARVCYSSRTTSSLQDPMPKYVDPELVKLIAQNAPFELDVFMRSLHKSSTKRRAESGSRCDGAAKEGERRPLAVEALLSSMRERNDHLSIRQGGQDIWHSCPEGIWSDCDETDENICRATAVKRKRPKSVDSSRLPPSDRQCPSGVSFRVCDNKGRGKLRRASLSSNSSDEGSNFLDDKCRSPVKTDAFDVSSAAAPPQVGNDCDMLSAKPWRHGMRKGKRSAKDERPPNAGCCKRKAETDSRKTSEVRKYMETKMVERRKEQQQLKAEADAALAARKDQQRKLDLHQQLIFQSQVAGAKSLGHSPRPAWVSEYNSLCEPPRPWSSSSGELNTYLPPPVTPPNLDPVPLDLYATQLQFAEACFSTPRTDGIQVQTARESRRSMKARGCSREVQRQLKYGRSKSMKEFPHTDLELAKLVNSPVSRKARWKAKTKLRERKVLSEEVFQRQFLEHNESYSQRRSGDLEVYKRSLKRQFYSNGGSLCSAAKESRPQKSTSKISRKTSIKPMRPAESSLKSVIKDQARPVTKVKRLKGTQHLIPGKVKELTGEELATLLNANRLPSDSESETNVTRIGQVIAERMIIGPSQTSPASEEELITDLRKCVDHSLGSPQKHSTDEDVLCKWFGPSVECPEQHVIDEDARRENTGQMLGSSFKPSRNNREHLQVLNFNNEKTGDTDIVPATSKNPTIVVRWQRMQLLKNLAEQLVKRVDEACAKKRQIELSAVEQTSFPSMDINIEPSGQLPIAESGHWADTLEPKVKLNHLPNLNNGLPSIHLAGSLGDKFQDSEPKFFYQSKQNNIINYRGLTEQEQAGFESRSVQTDETQSKMKKVISSPRRASRTETTDYKAEGGPTSEMCTMKERTTSDKCTDITCNNASASSSFGSSSPTASSSPVVLPTSTTYHMGRIKHCKTFSSEAKTQPKKEGWIIPAENDTHSIFNVYTQHLKDRKKLAASTLTSNLQNVLENSASDEIEIDPEIAGPAAEVGIANVPSIPLSRKLTVPEFLMKPPKPINVQTTGSADYSHESTESPVSDGIGPDLQKKHDLSSPNCESLQIMESRTDESGTRFPPELTNLKTSTIELAAFHPEWTVLEMGDLKVCQSPTSIHLRLDRCKDNGEDRKAIEQKLVNVSHEPNVGNCTEASINASVRSKQETGGKCVRNVPSRMKITYARRVHARARPDDGCTNDERVVVEWHQMNAGVPPVASQEDTKLDSSELDASEEARTGLPGPRQSEVIGNAQSQFVEACAVKHSSVNEEDFKGAYLFNKAKAHGASEPIIDCAFEHKLRACDGEARSLRTMLTCQKGELSVPLNRNSELDPQIEIRDSEEWELKRRRDQLEAELKKLDADIMKTRAKLHQRQPMIDSQAHSVSSISFTDHPVEGAFKLDKFSNIQKRFAKHMAINDKHNDVFEDSTDLQMQKFVDTHFSQRALKYGEKTVTTSNSYSDSFISEETELGPKTLGTGKRDCFVDHLRSTENFDVYGGLFRELKTGIQQFGTVLENRPQDSQSNALKKQAEVPSNHKMPSTLDAIASEGSEIRTGKGPGTRLDKPPEVDCDESTSRCRKSKARLVSDQLAEIDDVATRLYVKDERTTFQRHAVCTSDELLDAVHDVVNAEEKSGKGPWIPRYNSPQQTEEKVIRRNEEQICFEQKRRNSQELPEFGAGESPSSVVQSGAQHANNSKNLTPWGGDIEILPGIRTPRGIKQNGWPVKGDEGNSQSNASKKQIESQSHSKMPSTQDERAVEGSDRVTGSCPRRLEKPPEVDCDESTARHRTSKVRPVPDQMVQMDITGVRLFAKDERTMLQSHTVCSRDGLLDAFHNLVDAEEKSGRGPWTPLHPIPQHSEETVLGKNKDQTYFQQTGTRAQVLPEYGAGERPSSVVQCGAQICDKIKGLMPGGRDDKAAVSGGVEIIPGNRTPPGLKQNGRPLKGEEIIDTSCDLVEVPRGPIHEQTEGKLSHAVVARTLLWSARTLEDGSERVPSIKLSKLSQTIQAELASRKLASFQNTNSLLAAEDSSRTVTTEVLPFPLPTSGQSEESISLVPSLHHSLQNPVELPQQNPFQCNAGLSNEEKSQMMVDDVWNRPTCSHEGKISDKAAPTVPEFIHLACLTPLNIPCGSATEEAPWECLSLPSHMDFSTIREKLRNTKLASDEHPITDGWSVNPQYKSFDSPTPTTGGESSGGHTLVSESIITSDVPVNSKDIPECLRRPEFEQAAKSKCSSEVDVTQENGFLKLLSRPESTIITIDPNNHFTGTQGLFMPLCSTRKLPSFLPSLDFHQRTTKSNVPEEVDSIISEDIEYYESDVVEELQDDVEGLASGNFETTCTSPPPSNDFTLPTPDSGCCLGDRSPNVQVFYPEPGLSVTNELNAIISHAQKCNSSDCIGQDLTGGVPEPCLASGMGSPFIMSPRCPENPSSLHAGGQKKSSASTCASLESGDGDMIGRTQSVKPTRNENRSLQDISRISEDYYFGSEVSESHDRSENISEELPSIDSELSSNGSGPAQENIHKIDTVELNNREEIDEVGKQSSGDELQNLDCNAMACSAPSDPDYMHHADKQHPGSFGHITTAAGTAKLNPDMNFLHRSCVVTEKAKSEDNSHCQPVHFASHHESETSKPAELPLSITLPPLSTVLPPLRPSKYFKQYDGTHFSDALRIGKLSTKETFFENTLGNNEHLSTKMAGLQLESAYTEALTEALSAASPAPISSPGVMVKSFNNVFNCEPNKPGTVCTLELTRVEDNEIPVQKSFDVEVICLSPHQVGPLQLSNVKFSVDLAQKVDCNSEDSLSEELEKVGQRETHDLSKKLTGADSSLGNQNINVDEEVIDSAIAVPICNIFESAGVALEKLRHQCPERLNFSIPLDCASLYAPTCRANDTLDFCPFLTSIGNGKQLLGECKTTKIDSNKSFYSFNGDKSIGGPPTSTHLMVQANRNVLSLPKVKDGDRPPNMYLRPDQIVASCQASTFSRPSPFFRQQKIVNLDKDAENQAQYRTDNGQVSFQDTKTNAEFEGCAGQQYSDVCSLQVFQTNLLAQHDSTADSNCSNKEGILSHSLEHVAKSESIGGVPEAPVAEDLEACSSESCSSNRSSLIFVEEKEEVRSCEILEGVGRLNSYQVSCAGISKDRMQLTTCLATLHEASSCANASPKLDVRMQMDVSRAEKLDIMTDLVTSLIYENLLSVELSGLHQEVGRTPTSLQISSQAIQTASVTKPVNSKPKRSRKISGFCQVLKHFLPTGWRSASIRHKKGLFLHVQGLRPHPLNPASKAMPGTLKLNVQCPNYQQYEHFPKSTNTQFLLLDVNDVYSYVQRSFELFSPILDPSPANWHDSRKPVGEDSFTALESQFWETGHMFGNSRWQMHKTLILDLINEALLKQFATKLLVPSFSMKTLALPAGGENLVQFVTKEIVEHERYASNRGFDIEKVIAKAFEDEHWEKCSEEAKDIVGDLSQGILCDLIERFIHEMVRGWGYHTNQRHVLAS